MRLKPEAMPGAHTAGVPSARALPPAKAPIARNAAHDSTNGTSEVRSMAGMLPDTVVRVSVATSRALVETGEQRSPKYAPDRTAPPVNTAGTPASLATKAQMVPMVAAVPNDVPVRNDMSEHKRNVASKTTGPEHMPEVASTM